MLCAMFVAAHMGRSIADTTVVARWVKVSECAVRIDGDCASACVILLCTGRVMPGARLFYAPIKIGGGTLPAAERLNWSKLMAQYMPPRMGRWFMAGPAHETAVT